MLPAESHAVPSLNDVFAHNIALLNVLKRAEISSIVPLMLLPKSALPEIPGIKDVRAAQIAEALAGHGLGHRTVNDRACDFLTSEFGSIQDAPIDALHVTSVRHFGAYIRPLYAPLRLVQILGKVNPGMTIGSLLRMERTQVHQEILEYLHDVIPVHQFRRDMSAIDTRLILLNEGFRIGSLTNQLVIGLYVGR